MENVLEITGEELKSVLASTDNVVLVDFWAPWCGPCRTLGPTLESIANETEDVTLVKINVDQNSGVASKYGIRSIPSVFVFKGEEQVDKFVGIKSKEEILSIIDNSRAGE